MTQYTLYRGSMIVSVPGEYVLYASVEPILRRLPVTADGVYLLGGETVYDANDNAWVVDYIVTAEGGNPARAVSPDGDLTLPNCYSTREAANNARAVAAHHAMTGE